MLNLVLFGPPGAGKGTQSQKLIEKYGLIHLSTGDLLRSEISQGTALGLEAKKLMDQGILVPDEVVIGMISNKLDANHDAKGFIFDGFPRTVAQAEALDQLLDSKNAPISGMIALEVPDDELDCVACYKGERNLVDLMMPILKSFGKRNKEYNEKTAPVAGVYKRQNKLTSVDGTPSADEVFEVIRKIVDAWLGDH